MKKIITTLAAVSITMAMAVFLGGCTNPSSGSEASAPTSEATGDPTNASLQHTPIINHGAPTAKTLVAAVGGISATPSPINERAVKKAYAAVKYSDALPVTDLKTCMAAATLTDNSIALGSNSSYWTFAISGARPGSAFPDTAFAAMLDPTDYSKAKTSGNTFDMMDLNKSIKPEIKEFSRSTNKLNLQYVSYDDPSGANTILQYGHRYDTEVNSKMGFIVNDEYALVGTAPVYSKTGIETRCMLFIAGQNGDYTFVPVSDQSVARRINALVVAHKVHPRYILQPLFWDYRGDKTSVEVYGILAKLQLVGPNGGVLAETSFGAGNPPKN